MTLVRIVVAAMMFGSSAAAGASDEPVKTDCAKPALINRPGITAQELGGVMQRVQAYVTCMSTAIEVQRKLTTDAMDQAKMQAEKTNAMITDVNAFVAEVKAYQAEHSGK